MTPAAYQSALSTLGLTPDQAGEWLGIGRSTAWRYLKAGAPGPVERALGVAVGVVALAPEDVGVSARYVNHSDLTAALELPGKGAGE